MHESAFGTKRTSQCGQPCLLLGVKRTSCNPPMECALRAGQVEASELTVELGFQRMKAMARHRSHSIEFKRQVAQEFIAGETLYGLSKRHDISRQLIRVWVQKYEAGALDEDAQAADLLQEYEAKVGALERMVGRQALDRCRLAVAALKVAINARKSTAGLRASFRSWVAICFRNL